MDEKKKKQSLRGLCNSINQFNIIVILSSKVAGGEELENKI